MTRLVGREGLVSDLSRSVLHGDRVAVVGEAGIGKTAVLRAAARASGRPFAEGGGLATLGWHSYLPLVRALRVPMPPGDAPAVAAFVTTRLGGRALILDDVHWADEATLAVLPLLAEVPVLAGVRTGSRGSAAATSALVAAGFGIVELEPLADHLAAVLAHDVNPGLPADTVSGIVAGAGGNPLYVAEQARHNRSSASLRLLVTERLSTCSAPARQALAALALLARPAPRRMVGSAVDELLSAQLVTVDSGVDGEQRVALRHGLLGDAAVSALAPEDRRRLHLALARALADPGEAARHHAAGGDRDAAFRCALVAVAAATDLDERAAHLSMAASVAPPREAAELIVAAATAHLEAERPDRAVDLLDRQDGVRDAVGLRSQVTRARALAGLGRYPEARQAAVAGLREVPDALGAEEVHLRVELARARAATSADPLRAVLEARGALALAERLHLPVAGAVEVVGTALLAAWSPAAVDTLAAAHGVASAPGDACRIASALVAAHVCVGDLQAAEGACTAAAAAAAMAGRRRWELHFAVQASRLALLRGEASSAARESAALLGQPLRADDLDLATAVLIEALVASGDLDAAGRVATAPEGRHAGLARARLAWVAGRPQATLRAVAQLSDVPPTLVPALACLEGWAFADTGRVVVPAPEGWPGAGPTPPSGPGVAARLELRGLAALSAGDHRSAGAAFDAAAGHYLGCDAVAAGRCRWAAAEATVRAGDLDEARDRLAELAGHLRREGLTGMLPRVARSARATGTPMTTPRPPVERRGLLSPREQEVLTLVAAGLSTRDIAARLALAPSTVETQVRSAMRKLGARTRRQAAAAAATLEREATA